MDNPFIGGAASVPKGYFSPTTENYIDKMLEEFPAPRVKHWYNMSFLVALSLGIGKGYTIYYKGVQKATIWGALVGYSAFGKTPSSYAAMPGLDEIQRILKTQYKNSKDRYKESKVKKTLREPYVKVSDTTLQGTLVQMNANPNGFVIVSDELSAFFFGFDQFKGGGGGNTRQAFMKLFDGQDYTSARGGDQGNMSLPDAHIPIIGGITYDQLPNMKKSSKSDGFVFRWLFATPDTHPKLLTGRGDYKKEKEAYAKYLANMYLSGRLSYVQYYGTQEKDNLLNTGLEWENNIHNVMEDKTLCLGEKKNHKPLQITMPTHVREMVYEYGERLRHYCNYLLEMRYNDDVSMIMKLEAYFAKFILIRVVSSVFDPLSPRNEFIVTEEDVLKSWEQVCYFYHSNQRAYKYIFENKEDDQLTGSKRALYAELIRIKAAEKLEQFTRKRIMAARASLKSKNNHFNMSGPTLDRFLKEDRYFNKVDRGVYELTMNKV